MLIYILIRLFVRKRNYSEGDELRHIITARNFYKLWNKSTYDMHPPLYSWLVRLFKSGVVVSLLCSIGLYIVSSKLYETLGLTSYQKTIALTFLTFNYTLIYYSNKVFRYQLIALLGTSAIYLLLVHNWFAAGLTWGLLGLTCTFAGLRGFFAWGLLGFNPISVITFLVVFGSWLVEKAIIYKKNVYYPSGAEGMLEKVYPFTWRQLLSPLYFPWIYSYYGKSELGYDFKNWFKRAGGVLGLYPPLTFLVPVALFFVVKGALKSPLWISALTLALLYPSLYKRFLPRNSIIAIPLIGFLLAKGLPSGLGNALFWGSWAVLVGFLYKNRVLCFLRPQIRAQEASLVLNKLPKDGVLAEGFICQPIAYWTDKRVVALSLDPEKSSAIYQTNLAIYRFSLNYAVISGRWRDYIKGSYPALDYIRSFKLIETILEDDDIYEIYEIPQS